MIKAISSKTFDNLRDGVKDGMDSAWKASKDGMDSAWKASKRMQFRSPIVYERRSSAWAGGWIGLAIFSTAALALGAWLYFRKRKQVADHYTMGEGPGPSWEADQVSTGHQMSNPA